MDPITKALLTEFVAQHGLEDLPEDKAFEHFVGYSVVSSRYPEEFRTDEIVIGGGNDLGIDAAATIVNGRLVCDPQEVDDLLEMNGYLDVEFIFVQAKRTPSFDGGAILTFCENVKNGIFCEDAGLPVNEYIAQIIEIKKRIFASAAKLKGNPECRLYYVTTGFWAGDAYLTTIIDRKRLELESLNMFKNVRVEALGAQQIQKMYRDTKTSITKQIIFDKFAILPPINGVKSSYIGALPAKEYLKLITDEDGSIIKSIFVDNVRDFQGQNPVNIDISNTITTGLLDQFVLRNNGITVVTRDLNITGSSFTLKDYQVVNGCQTSHVLYENSDNMSGDLFVPLKLIYTDDEEITQDIIKSTNRQTPIDDNDLLALTKFQRDLETYYAGFNEAKRLYYERRSKQYGQNEVDKNRIVPVGMQLKYFASMFLDSPHQAGRYQATLLKSVKDRVFKPDHRPEPYYTSAFAAYRFDPLLRKLAGGDADLRPFKFYFLLAFRYMFEAAPLPPLSSKKLEGYCASLNAVLWDADAAKAAFDRCGSAIRDAAASKGVKLVRDSAKTQSLADAVRALAQERNATRQPEG